MALVVVITAIAIIAVFVADLIENTATDFHVAESERDRLKAEYLAKSGLNLMRLLIGHEPEIRAVVAPFYQMLLGTRSRRSSTSGTSPTAARAVRRLKSATGAAEETGIDFSVMKGVKDTGGTFEVITVPENSKINLNKPLFFNGDDAPRPASAMQLFALMGGFDAREPVRPDVQRARSGRPLHHAPRHRLGRDRLVGRRRSAHGVRSGQQARSRAAAAKTTSTRQLPDPYVVKNAPFDSLEELRLVRGVGDDFWATFIEAEPDDPRERKVTIYGSGAVNVNMAHARGAARAPVLVRGRPAAVPATRCRCWRSCSCSSTARAIVPVALFSTPQDFFNFISGKANAGIDLYAALHGLLGEGLAADGVDAARDPARHAEPARAAMFLTEASIFTHAIDRHGRAHAGEDRRW